MSLAGNAFKGAASLLRQAPFTTAGAGVLLGSALLPALARPLKDNLGAEMRGVSQERDLALVEAAKARRLQRLMAENTARLAAADPHTYYEVLAGRRLPTGAVVLGGRPRTDLMEQLAMGMSTGKFAPPPPEDDLMNLL
jgi:hypothetical protein